MQQLRWTRVTVRARDVTVHLEEQLRDDARTRFPQARNRRKEVVGRVCARHDVVVDDSDALHAWEHEVLERLSASCARAQQQNVRAREPLLPVGAPEPQLSVVLGRRHHSLL